MEEEGVDADGAEAVGGVAVLDRLDWNYTLLHLMVA